MSKKSTLNNLLEEIEQIQIKSLEIENKTKLLDENQKKSSMMLNFSIRVVPYVVPVHPHW